MNDWDDDFNYLDQEGDQGEEIDPPPEDEQENGSNSDNNTLANEVLENKEIIDLSSFENLFFSRTTTVRVFESGISKEDILTVKGAVGANIILLNDKDDIKGLNKKSKVILADEESHIYTIIFINEDLTEYIEEKSDIKFEKQTLLKKEDITDEPSRILAG